MCAASCAARQRCELYVRELDTRGRWHLPPRHRVGVCDLPAGLALGSRVQVHAGNEPRIHTGAVAHCHQAVRGMRVVCSSVVSSLWASLRVSECCKVCASRPLSSVCALPCSWSCPRGSSLISSSRVCVHLVNVNFFPKRKTECFTYMHMHMHSIVYIDGVHTGCSAATPTGIIHRRTCGHGAGDHGTRGPSPYGFHPAYLAALCARTAALSLLRAFRPLNDFARLCFARAASTVTPAAAARSNACCSKPCAHAMEMPSAVKN